MFSGIALDPGSIGFHVPFRTFVEVAANAGFDSVEAPVMAATALGGGVEFRQLIESARVTAELFSCPWSGVPNASVDDALWEERLNAAPELFTLVRRCDGRLVSVFFNGAREGMKLLGRSDLSARLRALTSITRSCGLILCVELNDTVHLRNAGEILADADPTGQSLKLLVDVFHVYRSGLDRNWIEQLPHQRIGWVHVSDVPHGMSPSDCEVGIRCAPGEGQLDLATILHAIARNGYGGPLSVEVLERGQANQEPLARATHLLTKMRQVLDLLGTSYTKVSLESPPLPPSNA